MKDRAVHFLSVSSGLLAAAVLALWVRSYFAHDVLLFPFARHACGVYSVSGQLLVRFGGFPYTPGGRVRLYSDPATILDGAGPGEALIQFGYVRWAQPPGGSV